MPYNICGYVEVGSSFEDQFEELWFAVISIGSFNVSWGLVSEALFGLTKQKTSDGPYLAADRGWPLRLSSDSAREYREIEDFELREGESGCFGFTHATWAEVKAVPLDGQSLIDSDWGLLLDMVRLLEQRFAPERIRFVVWANR